MPTWRLSISDAGPDGLARGAPLVVVTHARAAGADAGTTRIEGQGPDGVGLSAALERHLRSPGLRARSVLGPGPYDRDLLRLVPALDLFAQLDPDQPLAVEPERPAWFSWPGPASDPLGAVGRATPPGPGRVERLLRRDAFSVDYLCDSPEGAYVARLPLVEAAAAPRLPDGGAACLALRAPSPPAAGSERADPRPDPAGSDERLLALAPEGSPWAARVVAPGDARDLLELLAGGYRALEATAPLGCPTFPRVHGPAVLEETLQAGYGREWIEGPTLRELAGRGEPVDLALLGRAVADLQEAVSRDLIRCHGDLGPARVIAARGRYALVDLAPQALPGQAFVVATPAFTPELVPGAAADVLALAATLYEAATGRGLFPLRPLPHALERLGRWWAWEAAGPEERLRCPRAADPRLPEFDATVRFQAEVRALLRRRYVPPSRRLAGLPPELDELVADACARALWEPPPGLDPWGPGVYSPLLRGLERLARATGGKLPTAPPLEEDAPLEA